MLDASHGVLIGLMLLLVSGSIVSAGWDVTELRNREVWWWTVLLALAAWLMNNQYAALLCATVIIGLWQIGRSWYVLRSTIVPITGCALAYALLAPYMAVWMVPWVLWTGTAVGLFLAAYGLIGAVSPRPYRYQLPWKWAGIWALFEDNQTLDRYLCGQAHRMHLTSLSALSMACAYGLVWMGQWWAAPALLVCYLPIHLVWVAEENGHPNVGHLGLLGLGTAALLVWLPLAGMALVSVLSIGVFMFLLDWRQWAQPQAGVDSGRLTYWLDVLVLIWWPAGWKARLIGFGTCSWFLKTIMIGETNHGHVFTAAHNEYLQQLIEHGLLGLLILLAYLGEALWRTGHGIPEQQAITLLGATWCAIALVHFPATFFHEYHSSTQTEEHWYGSPPLNVWTFVLALLAEVR